MKNEKTGPKVSKIAAKMLAADIDDAGLIYQIRPHGDGSFTVIALHCDGAEFKSLAASALTQAEDRTSGQIPGRKKGKR